MIGPLLIFDKSFLQMLNADEVFELSMNFSFVGTPTLIREIIADLKKDPGKRRIPQEVVKELSGKMCTVHGVQPVLFEKLTIANLLGTPVPMMGQVPVDSSAPNVRVSRDGRGILYDSVPEQHMWGRWSSGDFSTDDESTASAWRESLSKINLRAVGQNWKEFVQQRFPTARNFDELIEEVTQLLADARPEIQLELLQILLNFVLASNTAKTVAFKIMLDQQGSKIGDLAPYAASVLKLYLVFVGGLARGFIGPRASHYIDLQYLFYAPFCMVFVSSDRFHRRMWRATAGINTFVWGPDLKAELSTRVAARQQMTEEQRRAHAEKNGFYPVQMPDSIINDLWKEYMRPKKEIIPHTQARTIDDLDPVAREFIKNMSREFDME